LETAEQLVGRGLEVTVVEAQEHAMPRMDDDMSARVDAELRAHGVELLTRTRLARIDGDVVVQDADGERTLPADLVLIAVGVRPNLDLVRAAGATVGPTGAVAVDRQGRTDAPHVWAVGDVAESF